MKASAASIRTLLVGVLLLALDFYLIRDCFVAVVPLPYFDWPDLFQFGFLGSLLMTNVVVIGGSVILSRDGGRRRFLTGFVLSGAVAIAALLCLALAIPCDWSEALNKLANKVTSEIDRKDRLCLPFRQTYIAYRLAVFTVSFTIPELLIATAGGLVARFLMPFGPSAVCSDHDERTIEMAP